MKLNGVGIVGLTVNCGTYDLLKTACASIWEHYPELEVIVVDNLATMAPRHSRIIHLPTGENIGHGPGICKGMHKSRADVVFLFDTDIVMNKPMLEPALEAATGDWYGVGKCKSDTSLNQRLRLGVDVKYLEPYACLLNRFKFFDYRPPTDHGMPMIAPMVDIAKKKDDVLVDFDIDEYVEHLKRGTFDKMGRKASYDSKERAISSAGRSIWSEECF